MGTIRKVGWLGLLAVVALGLLALPAGAQTCAANWQWANPLPQGNTISGLAYDGTTYVAVGAQGTIRTSPDGMNWTDHSLSASYTPYLTGVTYGAGHFVAVGGNTAYVSADGGLTWGSNNTGAPGTFLSISYAGSQFLGVGDQGTIATSLDGSAGSWTSHNSGVTLPNPSYPNILRSVAYGAVNGQGLYVAVGWLGWQYDPASIYAVITTSTDGVNWTRVNLPDTSPEYQAKLWDVAFGGGTFVISDASGDILTSTDGSTWTFHASSLPSSLPGRADSIIYDGSQFVAAGFGQGGLIATSPDGINWTPQNTGVTQLGNSFDFYAALYAGGLYLAGGNGGVLVTSTDAQNWYRQGSGYLTDLNSVAYGGLNVGYAAVGDGDVILWSPDGSSWSPAYIALNPGQQGPFLGVTYGNGLFVAVGSDGVSTSSDGTNWSTPQPVPSMHLNAIAYASGYFVAVGSYFVQTGTVTDYGAGIVISTDGSNWTQAYSDPYGGTNPCYGLSGIAYGNGQFVAVGGGYSFSDYITHSYVLASSNATHWISVYSGKPAVFSSVAFGNGIYYVSAGWIGLRGTYNSSTGWTWETVYNQPYFPSLLFDGTQFVGAGSLWNGLWNNPSFIYTSPDGLTWTGRATPSGNGINGVAFGDGTYVAVGYGGTILTSTCPIAVTGVTNYGWTPTPSNQGYTDGGDTVTVKGWGFTGATQVMFDGNAATGVTVVDDTQLTCTTPPHAAGDVHVTVTSPAGTSAPGPADLFTYTAESPTITPTNGIVPNNGTTSGGTSVTITGTHFIGATSVTFGGFNAASFTVVNSTTIHAVTPPYSISGAHYAVDVVVTTAGASTPATLSGGYLYNAPQPVVTKVVPNTGSTGGGTPITVTGSGFKNVLNASDIVFAVGSSTYGSPTIYEVVSDTKMTMDTPAGPAAGGQVYVVVTTGGGTSGQVAAALFTYVAYSKPTLTSIAPATSGSPAGGETFTITGTGFEDGSSNPVISAVTFGTVPAASFTVTSATTMTVVTPAHVPGTANITAVSPAGTSDPLGFTFTSQPVVTAVSPTTGPLGGGTTVTITGGAFTGASIVRFGSTPAASFTVLSDTSITVVSPAHVPGAVHVTVTTLQGTSAAVSADQFTYVTVPLPVISAISPNQGTTLGGTTVTLSGSGFTGATAVHFGANAGGIVSIASDTSMTVLSPAHAAAGTVDITVTTPGGTSATSNADKFTYATVPAPTVTAVTPANGPVTGGTSVTISGTNFTGATAVHFGSASATFTVVSDSSITATSPAASVAGAVDVTVTTPSGTSTTSAADQFIYGTVYTITGTITLADGKTGIAGVAVSAGAGSTATTAADGTYTLKNLPAGTYTVIPSKTGYTFSPASQSETITTASVSNVNFTGTPFFSISGKVTLSGSGLSGVTVTAGTGLTAITAADGTYTIAKVPASATPYIVTPSLTGYMFTPSSQSVTVTNANVPNINFAAVTMSVTATATPVTGNSPLAVTFGATVTGGTSPFTYDWKWGDHTADGTTQNPTHTYYGAGVYNVVLTVTDSKGATAADSHLMITVSELPLAVTATANPTSGGTPLTVNFSATATGGSGSYTFNWIFGDGGSATTATATHTYTSNNIYTAMITVTDSEGHTVNKPITITALIPPAITSVKKMTSPFRLKISGANFQVGAVVKIGGVSVPFSDYKSSILIIAKKGATLKAMAPKGVPVQVTVTNPDGGVSAAVVFVR